MPSNWKKSGRFEIALLREVYVEHGTVPDFAAHFDFAADRFELSLHQVEPEPSPFHVKVEPLIKAKEIVAMLRQVDAKSVIGY